MKLINDFFEIVEEQGAGSLVEEQGARSKEQGLSLDDFSVQVKLNADHYIYRAHFPNNPITPGVCLVQMAAEILELRLGKQLQLNTAVNIKFRKPVAPTDCPTFLFRKMSIADDKLSVSISVEYDDAQLVRMSLVYDIC
jgi:3-hydroxyacyl-[acyl-carrier-protein] dehydratase